jgi:DNA-binding transcriptional ArsR family regulator
MSIANAYRALGDPTRREILRLLREGEMAAGDLAGQFEISWPSVSRHLKVLEGAGLVEHHSVGTRNLYALAPPGFVALQQWLVGTWDEALSAYADAIRDHSEAQP